ncbi:MAG TPA: NAD-dependent epimerase/dehydratase family protein [Chthoniobacter sp.]
MRLLVTGGCGFLGSNFLRFVLQHYGPEMITNVDSLITGKLANVDGVAAEYGTRYEFLQADIADSDRIDEVLSTHQYFAVVNFASASATGAEGVATLLERARQHKVRRFVQVSKDRIPELGMGVGGPETGTILPADEYQAEADEIAIDAYRQYEREVVVTRSANNYGPMQSPGAFVSGAIIRALRDEPVPVPGDGSAARPWIHVDDHSAAVFAAVLEGHPGSIYHLTSEQRLRDLDVAHAILEHLGKSRELIRLAPFEDVSDPAPDEDAYLAHEELDWEPRKNFATGLRDTVDWYVHNREWWER